MRRLEAAPRPKLRNRGSRSFVISQFEMSGGFAAEGEFGAIHAVNPRVATGRGMSGGDARAGKEAELHQAEGLIFGEIEVVENAMLAAAKVGKRRRRGGFAGTLLFDTQLHLFIQY